jgi:hypothetical protein
MCRALGVIAFGVLPACGFEEIFPVPPPQTYYGVTNPERDPGILDPTLEWTGDAVIIRYRTPEGSDVVVEYAVDE